MGKLRQEVKVPLDCILTTVAELLKPLPLPETRYPDTPLFFPQMSPSLGLPRFPTGPDDRLQAAARLVGSNGTLGTMTSGKGFQWSAGGQAALGV